MNVYGVIEGRLSSGTINGSVTPETSINGSVSGGGALHGTLSPDASVTGTLSSGPTISADLTIPSAIGVDPYQGDYRITPNRQMQTLNTSGKYLQNVEYEAAAQWSANLTGNADGWTLTGDTIYKKSGGSWSLVSSTVLDDTVTRQ